MNSRQHVLIVSQNPRLANTLLSSLGSAGYELALVATFAAAKVHLRALPDLVIADVKLGAYNGLHLAVRAQSAGIPIIVIGPQDPVLQRDATSLGALYLDSESARVDVLKSVHNMLGTTELPATDDFLPHRLPASPKAFPAPSSVAWELLLGDGGAASKSPRTSKRMVVLH